VLTTRLLHPEILRALGSAGHGARVLIADGNYPFSTEAPAAATRVFLNLRRGLVSVVDVLDVLVASVPIESVLLMETPDGQPVPIHGEYRARLSPTVPLSFRKRHEFYAEAKSPATTLVIATGEHRRFANVLLTIGVVRDEPGTGPA
jgi:L-fucose mutarotase